MKDNSAMKKFLAALILMAAVLLLCFGFSPLFKNISFNVLGIDSNGGEGADILKFCLQQNLIPIIFGAFLMVFGSILFLISSVMIIYDKKSRKLIISGIFIAMTGVWTFCYSEAITVFSDNLRYNEALTYISLYSLLLLGTLLYNQLLFLGNRNVFYVLSGINAVFFFIAVGMSVTYGENAKVLLVPYMLLSFIEIIMIGKNLFDALIDKRDILNIQDIVFILSLLIYAFASFLDSMVYFLGHIIGVPFLREAYTSFVTGAGVFFAIGILINYMIVILDSKEFKQEKEELLSIAYVDKLTQISNRTKIERDMKILENSDRPYIIISFDLNHLKQVNDTYGHNMGDALIKGFASILDKCFGQVGTVGRMGGDEFLVVVQGISRNDVEQRLLTMESLLARESKKDKRLIFSSSYGYACSNEHPGFSPYQLYKLADEKMYKMKVRAHEKSPR